MTSLKTEINNLILILFDSRIILCLWEQIPWKMSWSSITRFTLHSMLLRRRYHQLGKTPMTFGSFTLVSSILQKTTKCILYCSLLYIFKKVKIIDCEKIIYIGYHQWSLTGLPVNVVHKEGRNWIYSSQKHFHTTGSNIVNNKANRLVLVHIEETA